MDREKSIVRSKSSNNGLRFRTEKKNTKSISDVDFRPNLAKKQKGRDKTANSLHTDVHQIRRKPPPRPRPGQKKFLTSVLTILSKSTTGTQYPDIQDKNIKSNKKINKHERHITTEKPKKQTKYKSRILNRNIEKSDQFLVLQSKKDIAQTPSNYSENITTNDIQNDKSKRSIRDFVDNTIYKTVAEGISNVEDKITKRPKKITINDDPETLASKTADEDKKFYNLFVDLLESTFNNYNLDNDALSDTNSDLKINESVAKKLTIKNEIDSNDVTLKTIKKDTSVEQTVFDNPIDIKLSDHKPIKRVKPVSVKSFVQPKKFDVPQTFSFQSKRIKNSRKKNLLNMFKEELQLNPKFEEPPNLFQALKVMAKNKKVHVIENPDNIKSLNIDPDDFDSRQCKLRRRKVISMKTKKHTKMDRGKIIQRYSEYNPKIRKREKSPIIPESHSLEVFEYTYEEPKPKYVYQNKKRENQNVGLAPRSSPFKMRSNLDYYTLLKFPDRSTYDFTY